MTRGTASATLCTTLEKHQVLETPTVNWLAVQHTARLTVSAMYPPQSLVLNSLSDETPPTSPLHSGKSSPILQKVDYAEAFTRVYHDSPQSSSPPSSLHALSSPGTHYIVSNIRKYSL